MLDLFSRGLHADVTLFCIFCRQLFTSNSYMASSAGQPAVRASSGSCQEINSSQVAREVAPFFQHCTIENGQFVLKS